MPIPHLNTDVLSFKFFFENAIDSECTSLFTLRSVNREWFEVVENISKLWATFRLDQKLHFTDPEYVVLHIRNSGGRPLEVTIIPPYDLIYDKDIPAIGPLRNAVPQLKSLTIDALNHEGWEILVSGIGKGLAAPILESLVIKVERNTSSFSPFSTLSTAFTPSPKLINVQLPVWPIAKATPPQLSTITSLTFDTPFRHLLMGKLFDYIRHAPHLEYFKFRSPDMGEESAFSHPTISVPQLRRADVTVPGHGLDMLRSFKAPLLADVRLDGYRKSIDKTLWEHGAWARLMDLQRPGSEILSILSARSPRVRSLELRYFFVENPDQGFGQILTGETFPLLQELVLKRIDISDAALRKGNSLGRSTFRKIEFRDCRKITAAGVEDFVRERANPELVICFHKCRWLKEKDVLSLSKLVHVEVN